MVSAKLTAITNVLQGQRLAVCQVHVLRNFAFVAEVLEVDQLTVLASTDIAHCQALLT